MMSKIVECVCNFSEGRDTHKIKQIIDAYDSVPKTQVVHSTSNSDTHRSVVTLLGTPESILEAVFKGIETTHRLVDMRKHRGIHPRQGSTDVCPFVPLQEVSMQECIQLAKKLAQRLGDELQIPVYLYQEAASILPRRSLGYLRQGQYESLPRRLLLPEWKPDFGPVAFQPRCGVTQVGARNIMIAWNIDLGTTEPKIAKKIAFRIREKGVHRRDETGKILHGPEGNPLYHAGLFQEVMATGWFLEQKQHCQITMNVMNYPETPLAAIWSEVLRLASAEGVSVLGSELIGLLPEKALLQSFQWFQQQGNSEASLLESQQKQMHWTAQKLGLYGNPFSLKKNTIEQQLVDFQKNLDSFRNND